MDFETAKQALADIRALNSTGVWPNCRGYPSWAQRYVDLYDGKCSCGMVADAAKDDIIRAFETQLAVAQPPLSPILKFTGATPPPWKWRILGGEWMLVRQQGGIPVVLACTDNKIVLRDTERDRLIPFDPTHPDARLIEEAPRLLASLMTGEQYVPTVP